MSPQRANIHRTNEWFEVLQTTPLSQTAVMKLAPGQASGDEPQAHESSDQVLLLIEGELAAEIAGQRSRMQAGDVVVIPPGTLHKFTNPGDVPALTFSVYSPPEYPPDEKDETPVIPMSRDALIRELAARHGVSEDAVRTLSVALERSGGRLAQFSHPDLGGYGQWMPGMTQIGDMFNSALRDRVDRLCQELNDRIFSADESMPSKRPESTAISQPNPIKPMSPMKPMEPMKAPERWWPKELGDAPNSAGGQNETRYAFFGDKRRLAVDTGDGKVSVYDTGDHRISGVQQHQSGGGRKTMFTSQHGEVDLATLTPV
jgi:mannose-6-phosphate isomerase-like protein (cupin superfamily)